MSQISHNPVGGGGGGAGVFTSLVVNPGPTTLTGTLTQTGLADINISGTADTLIGTGTNSGTITIGNATSNTQVNILSPFVNIDSTASGEIDIGDSVTNGSIYIGQSIINGFMQIGNISEDSGINIYSGDIDMDTTGDGTIQIGQSIGTGQISIGIGITTGSIIIGISLTTGELVLGANGNAQVVPATGGAASPVATATINHRVGVAIFTGFTTASAASQAFTIANSTISTTSFINVTVSNLNASGNGALMSLVAITQSASQIVVHTTNNGPGALGSGDNVLISFVVNS